MPLKNLSIAGRPQDMAGWPPNCTNFTLLFGIALFLTLHHSVSEDFLTWYSKAHQVRYKYMLPTSNFIE
jgi:hypothetical protein